MRLLAWLEDDERSTRNDAAVAALRQHEFEVRQAAMNYFIRNRRDER